ncbi:hypothetical protein N184_17750 [Sinorhizobium sp. GL28]|nr:hypothetical protein N184_17750 [Sinorhizobium sp. GL28]
MPDKTVRYASSLFRRTVELELTLSNAVETCEVHA